MFANAGAFALIEEECKLSAADSWPVGKFGDAVAVFDDLAVIGAPGHDDAGTDSGLAHLFIHTEGTWIESQVLRPLDAVAGDRFGYSAAMTADAIVIAAPYNDDNGNDAGAVYVFCNAAGQWAQTQKLLAGDGQAGDKFGYTIAIAGDVLIVGAPGEDELGSSAGAAYVFRNTNGTWTQTDKLTAAAGVAGDYFGTCVDTDGSTCVIGAMSDDEAGNGAGAVYVFVEQDGGWAQQQKLIASNAMSLDYFGRSVAISGNTMIAGANRADALADNSGAAYIFQYNGQQWVEQCELIPSDGMAYAEFGISIAIEGNTAVVGADRDSAAGDDSGAVYVFQSSGGTWNEVAKLNAPDAYDGDTFGNDVALSEGVLLIGSPSDNTPYLDAGSAYIFEYTPDQGSEDEFTLTLQSWGNGTVSASPQQDVYASGDVVELSATPANGWVFDHWGSDLWGADNPVQVTITQDLVVTAVFYEQEPCEGDLNGDRQVDLADLARLLENYGQSPRGAEDGDLNGDGIVNLPDLQRLLGFYGVQCE